MKKHKKIKEEASIIIKKVLSAIDYLHNNQICHIGIKARKYYAIKVIDLNSIKIIDFGLSEDKKEEGNEEKNNYKVFYLVLIKLKV